MQPTWPGWTLTPYTSPVWPVSVQAGPSNLPPRFQILIVVSAEPLATNEPLRRAWKAFNLIFVSFENLDHQYPNATKTSNQK
jgi:hypothetical protein